MRTPTRPPTSTCRVTTITVGAESNANADVVGDGSANASTDASGSVLKNGQPIGAAETSADGTLDGAGVDRPQLGRHRGEEQDPEGGRRRSRLDRHGHRQRLGGHLRRRRCRPDPRQPVGQRGRACGRGGDRSQSDAAANADGSAAVSDDSATANANANAEGSADVPSEALSPAVNVLLNTNTNTSATVE